jgi:sugar lactone lactonase YvrE
MKHLREPAVGALFLLVPAFLLVVSACDVLLGRKVGEDGPSVPPSPTITVTGSGCSRNVTLSADHAGGTIHYTIDGSLPTADSPVYSEALTVAGYGVTKHVRAVTIAEEGVSAVAREQVRIHPDRVIPCEVEKVVGTTDAGSVDGIGDSARLHHPSGIVSDGTYWYVVDASNHLIRRIDPVTREVITVAGSGTIGSSDGIGTAASFNSPRGITTDGTHLYVADTFNALIRKVAIGSWEVTTLAGAVEGGLVDGTAEEARFDGPRGVVTDGRFVYVADTWNNAIRAIDLDSAEVTTIAGMGDRGVADGIGSDAKFNVPCGIATNGTSLFVADTYNNVIREVDIATQRVSTLQLSPELLLNTPASIAYDGTYLYVANARDNKIARIDPSAGLVGNIAGSETAGSIDGIATEAQFHGPWGLGLADGVVIVCDTDNNMIRTVSRGSQIDPNSIDPTLFVPANVAVIPQTVSTAVVRWDGAANASGYEVRRDTSPDGDFSQIVYSGTGSLFTDEGMESDTTYYYKVYALSSTGRSLGSPVVAGTAEASIVPLVGTWVRSHDAHTEEVLILSSDAFELRILTNPFIPIEFPDDLEGLEWLNEVLSQAVTTEFGVRGVVSYTSSHLTLDITHARQSIGFVPDPGWTPVRTLEEEIERLAIGAGFMDPATGEALVEQFWSTAYQRAQSGMDFSYAYTSGMSLAEYKSAATDQYIVLQHPMSVPWTSPYTVTDDTLEVTFEYLEYLHGGETVTYERP